MTFVDLIEHKKLGGELTHEQIAGAVGDHVAGRVPDYQMAALLMAVRWRGLSEAETVALTEVMTASGERWDFDDLGVAVDKHSTGGVGDKTSLALAPLAAAAGCLVPMVSGRGLGHTGGTLDKIESIPGFRTDLGAAEFRAQIERIGVAMGAQTASLVPADRLLYALRDVTATIDDPGLITGSILSKKLAEGARGLVLDVKVGAGAFCEDRATADALAVRLLDVGRRCGLRVVALLTDMEAPLGRAVGNALEVAEAIAVLRCDGPADVTALVVDLTAEMLALADLACDVDEGRRRVRARLEDGSGLETLARLIEAQGGDPRVCDDPARLPSAPERGELQTGDAGYVRAIDARAVGRATMALRAGRSTREDDIDPAAGVVLQARPGDRVDRGQPWVGLEYGAGADVEAARRLLSGALEIGPEPPADRPLILERRA